MVGERDVNGLAHLTLLPMEMIGLTWLAANFCLRRWVAWLILAGALVDFPLGVMLHARMENLENRPDTHGIQRFELRRREASRWEPQGRSRFRGLPGITGSKSTRTRCARQWLGRVGSISRRRSGVRRRLADAGRAFQQMDPRRPDDCGKVGIPATAARSTFWGDVFGEGWAPCAACRRRCGWRCSWMLWRHLPPAAAPVTAIAAPAAGARKTRRKRPGRKR